MKTELHRRLQRALADLRPSCSREGCQHKSSSRTKLRARKATGASPIERMVGHAGFTPAARLDFISNRATDRRVSAVLSLSTTSLPRDPDTDLPLPIRTVRPPLRSDPIRENGSNSGVRVGQNPLFRPADHSRSGPMPPELSSTARVVPRPPPIRRGAERPRE